MPSIIGWIKNGRKGKNLAYMPASYPSERVAYGNGSVKDALDELNKGSVSVTADGVKKYGALLDELYALIDFNKLNKRSILYIVATNGAITVFPIGTLNTSQPQFGLSAHGGSEKVGFFNIVLKSSSSSYIYMDGTTETVLTNSVPASGMIIGIDY